MRGSRLLAGAAALLAVGLVPDASHAAEVGKEAPELKVAKWIQGTPVTLAEVRGKSAVLIELWASW